MATRKQDWLGLTGKVAVVTGASSGIGLATARRAALAGARVVLVSRNEEALREAGGVDVQLLGVGTDGHIAFNEPGSSLASRTRIKVLAEQTRRDNARFFDGDVEQVPAHCLTQGIATILEAGELLLLAFGDSKAEAIRQAVNTFIRTSGEFGLVVSR